MASIAQSDTESNVSGFVRYSEKNIKHLYICMLEDMATINQDILKVEKNMKNLVRQAGPFEAHLSALLQSLPKPNLHLPMQTD